MYMYTYTVSGHVLRYIRKSQMFEALGLMSLERLQQPCQILSTVTINVKVPTYRECIPSHDSGSQY